MMQLCLMVPLELGEHKKEKDQKQDLEPIIQGRGEDQKQAWPNLGKNFEMSIGQVEKWKKGLLGI